MTLDEIRQRRDDILRLATKHGAANVRIFGSVAQNTVSAGSDVDFLIDVVDSSRFRWGGGGLLMDLQNLLNCKVDLALPTSCIGRFANGCLLRLCHCEGNAPLSAAYSAQTTQFIPN